ncbi:TonB-dependent receptor [Roseateles toxinivorans]|uniref:Iron complex outermembrane receptor protein n=1 Tax=Roseateles toxinivorans TaxID=270368 RepID=A0A4R6QDM3_9BURK|nr:TonB-dependent receptor [Roseateles toxinivorans]TDP60410.1 iron complex outermembrane receptor protein [Roseateles toxinivorans]
MKQSEFTQTPLAAAMGVTFGTIFLLMAGGASSPALAQTQVQVQPDAVLPQITITARKRTERAIDVPLSISVLSGDELADRGAIRLSEAAVPNVVFLGPENNALPSFSVRGVQSQNRSNIGFDSGVGVYVDGIYMGRSAAFNLETFDIERVEFLRGPQGTLFGKNSIAGAISVVTREPSKRLEGSASVDLGTDNLRRLSGYVSAPLGSEAVRGSLAVYSGKRDGYMNNLATGSRAGDEDMSSARAKVLLKPSANLEITIAADYLKDKSVAPSSHIVSGYGFVAGSDDFSSNVDLQALANRTVQGVGGIVNYDFGNGLALTSITSVRKVDTNRTSDTDAGPINIVASANTSSQEQWSQEFRIASTGKSAVDFVAGVYLYEQKAKGSSKSTFGPAAPVFAPIRSTTGNTFGDINSKTAAVFGNVDWNVSKSLTLTGGLRYTREKKDLAYQQVVTFPAFLGSSIPLEHDSLSTNNVTPLVSARWRLDRDAIVYATYSKGFRSGGWNVDNITAGGPTNFRQTRFTDESMANYEIGAKGSLMGGNLNLGAAVYRMDYDDIQVTQQVAVLGGGGAVVGIVTNGGKARSQGFELEATMRPVSGLRLSGGVGYADAKYTDYVDTRSGAPVSFNGNKLNNAPRLTSNASVAYTLPLAIGALTLRVDARHTDGYFTGRENLATDRVPGYDLFGARVSLASESGRWEVTLYSNNLFDKRYIVAQGSAGFAAPVGAGTNQTVSYGRPRAFGIVGTLAF